jgi:hypothetical protein
MTYYPRSNLQEKRRTFVKRIGMAVSALMVLTMLVIFGLIVRSERAHDEGRCPFSAIGEQTLAGVRVVEEARTCLPQVEEHRWLVARPGKDTYELARKRLDRARFSKERFRWSLSQDEKQLLVLTIEVDGALSSEFREEDAVRREP